MSATAASAASAPAAAAAAAVEPASKVAVVTGANKLDGIGFAAAKALAATPNIHVVLTGRSAADGPKVLEALKKAGFANASYEALDHTDNKSIETAFGNIYSKHKHIDILVNNAGAAYGFGDAGLDTKIADMTAAYDTNTIGPLRVILRVAPHMKAQGYGRIINVSSRGGDYKLIGERGGMIAYRTSKLALNGITKLLSAELGPFGVLVNAYAPGLVATDMLDSTKDKWDYSKLGKVITADESVKGLVKLATAPVGSKDNGLVVPDRDNYY